MSCLFAATPVNSLLCVCVQLNQLPPEEREAALENLLGHHHQCGEHCGHDHDHSHAPAHNGQNGHKLVSQTPNHTHTADAATSRTETASE